MATITLKVPAKFSKIPEKDLEKNILNILKEYSPLDLYLLDKYIKTKKLPDSRFVNL